MLETLTTHKRLLQQAHSIKTHQDSCLGSGYVSGSFYPIGGMKEHALLCCSELCLRTLPNSTSETLTTHKRLLQQAPSMQTLQDGCLGTLYVLETCKKLGVITEPALLCCTELYIRTQPNSMSETLSTHTRLLQQAHSMQTPLDRCVGS